MGGDYVRGAEPVNGISALIRKGPESSLLPPTL